MSRPGKGNKAPIFSALPAAGGRPSWAPDRCKFRSPRPRPRLWVFRTTLEATTPGPEEAEGAAGGLRGPQPGRPRAPWPARPGSCGAGCGALPLAPVTKRAARRVRPRPARLSVSRLASHNKSLARS